ncbi:MAG: type II CRISPR-associated endonuclease Cas1 [Planctomycetota bacterium]|nr:MAG: type II CRISPR-associated endonuclease Cas1 [Planctomycetota bacterium]
MIDRILDFSSRPARLFVRRHQLMVEQPGQPLRSVPLTEVAVLLVAHPQVTYTQAVLVELTQAGGVMVVCDQRHLPIGLLLPLTGHGLAPPRMRAQADASRPTKKRLWQQIVRAKIRSQAACLESLHLSDFGLRRLVKSVRSGDTTNVEAQAARRYWQFLFGDHALRRDRTATDENLLLNYGYAVLRAIVARAIVAAGLHPALGIHHHHRENAYCLADDLMEPFRPLVDRAVVERCRANPDFVGLDPETKRFLVSRLTGLVELEGQQATLFTACRRLAASLVDVFQKKGRNLLLPQW